nr:ras GTPase-activating-like protein IQGAP1 [Cherax quadricarinatus]
MSAEEMDEQRQKNISYQYLCHLEEAKKWMEACINEELPEAGDLEEQLRHGVYLAKIAHFFAPETVPLRRIYDADLTKYRAVGLTFRHTDNISHFRKALEKIKLPSIFYPETTDVYDRKNMPRVVFCLHALSLYLFRLGIAPQIQNLYGKVVFSDEVMQAMMKELSKYDCQLPQFGKIGGILANELPVDEATLHAAIIAVNEAIEKGDHSELLETLINPSCHLQNILEENIDSYLQCLSDAKMHKKEMAVNKSRDHDYIPDAYDELLTQAEIQGHITYVNAFCATERVEDAVRDENVEALIQALCSPILCLKCIKHELGEEYLKALASELANSQDQGHNLSLNYSLDTSLLPTTLSKTVIQSVILSVNKDAEYQQKLTNGVAAVNQGLARGSPGDTLRALRSLGSDLPTLLDFAAPLYHEEMAAIRLDAQTDLSLEEIQGGVRLLSAVARVNAALDTNNPVEVWHYLSDSQTHLQSLEEGHFREYCSAMDNARLLKIASGDNYPFLTYIDLQQIVDEVNLKHSEDNSKIGALTAVNASVIKGNVAETMSALGHPALQLSSLHAKDSLHYYQLLKLLRNAKCEMLGDSAAELWLEDIEEVVDAVRRHAEESAKIAATLTKVNKALESGDNSALADVLGSPILSNLHIKKNYMLGVLTLLRKAYREKDVLSPKCPWIPYTLSDGSEVFLNLESSEYQWEKPEMMIRSHKSQYITQVDLEEAVSCVIQQEARNREVDCMMIKFQARARGWLIRQRIQRQKCAAVIIQAWWRMVRARRTYDMYCRALKMWEPYIIILQRAVRAWLLRRRLMKLSLHFTKNENQVIKIQRAWRAYKARLDLHSLTHQDNPPLSVIRKFINLLDVSPSDLDEEFRLQRVKSDMVKTIRHTQHLETEVDELDVKIGLLVHNRITLQDVLPADKENMNPNVPESKPRKGRRNSKDTLKCGTLRTQRGLKALKKESREKLLCYQHLFYLLQTEPHYLATLIFALPPGKTTKFIENVIFTLYNYGANDRDNYLLLKLFKTALEEEIRSRNGSVHSVITLLSGLYTLNYFVMPGSLTVAFASLAHGCGFWVVRTKLIKVIYELGSPTSTASALKPHGYDILVHPEVLGDSNIQINTNPVEIYKTWINQLEMNSGQTSGLPYTVNQDEALQYPEVQKRLAQAITTLKELTLAFCQQITTNRDLVPYAMLFMARVMRCALQRRFPHVPEKEILKLHLINNHQKQLIIVKCLDERAETSSLAQRHGQTDASGCRRAVCASHTADKRNNG